MFTPCLSNRHASTAPPSPSTDSPPIPLQAPPAFHRQGVSFDSAVVTASVAGVVALAIEAMRKRAAARDRRAALARDDVTAAMSALRALRAACRRRALATPDAPSLLATADLEDTFWLAVTMTLDARAMARADDYVLVAAMFAAGDDDVGAGDEEEAYRLLADALRGHLRAYR